MSCGKCHDCGTSLRSVLDGEEWCDTCKAYRRYRSHGWGSGGDDSPCPSILSAKFAVAEMGDQREIAQDNGDGTYTVWGYSVWGPIGSTGRPQPGVTIREPKGKREREEVASIIQMHLQALRSQNALYQTMKR